MSTLLLQSCSASKKEVTAPTSALDVYTGYFYKIIKKSMRDGTVRSELDIQILSAKHGLIHPDKEISTYDQRMTPTQADEMREKVLKELTELVHENGYSRIVVNMGKVYQQAIEGLEDRVDAEIWVVEGNGIGVKGNRLKRFIRGEDAVLEATT